MSASPHILLLFLDGVGLGEDDPEVNPFCTAILPTLHQLSGGQRWLRTTGYQTSERAVLIPTDPRMGVSGRPQSGTGQAAIVTGRNIPQLVGEHYGPKPNEATRALLTEDNVFKQVLAMGKTATLLEAYPPIWHTGIESGKHLPSSYQYAAQAAGLRFPTMQDLLNGDALSGDWTGEGWRAQLGFPEIPTLTPYEAGVRLVQLSRRVDFAFFPHWMTDVVGHRGSLADAVRLLEVFDGVMAGVMDTWQDDEGLVIITSDHGNIEEIGNRHHTMSDVPTVVIGSDRTRFAEGLHSLADIAPRIVEVLRK
ncbi:MAG: metalloenzyme [Anaerolineae bacterium]